MLSALTGFKHVKLESVSMRYSHSVVDPELGNRGQRKDKGGKFFLIFKQK